MSLDYSPTVGDVVVIHDPKLAQQLDRAGRLGVVVQLRRNDARVLFLPYGDAFWIATHRLYPHPQPEAVGPPIALVLAAALAQLRPEELELEEWDARRLVVSLTVRSVTRETVAALGERLQSALHAWEVRPYGMALVTLRLELRTEA